jgi:hypothetical protein
MEFDDVQVNVLIDPSVFARPSSIGPNGGMGPKP